MVEVLNGVRSFSFCFGFLDSLIYFSLVPNLFWGSSSSFQRGFVGYPSFLLDRMVKDTSLGRWRSWVQIPATPPRAFRLLWSEYARIFLLVYRCGGYVRIFQSRLHAFRRFHESLFKFFHIRATDRFQNAPKRTHNDLATMQY